MRRLDLLIKKAHDNVFILCQQKKLCFLWIKITLSWFWINVERGKERIADNKLDFNFLNEQKTRKTNAIMWMETFSWNFFYCATSWWYQTITTLKYFMILCSKTCCTYTFWAFFLIKRTSSLIIAALQFFNNKTD